MPDTVSVYEVSPRDGLQNEPTVVPLEQKVRLVEALLAAGITRIEAASFVSPKWVPQLADGEQLLARFGRREGITLSALCPNARGFERAASVGVAEVAVFLSASETHNRKNINRTVDEALAIYAEVTEMARAEGVRVRGYVSTVWGCPYEGEVEPARALSITRRLLEMGCYEISLGDTIGVGTPLQTRRIVDLFAREVGLDRIALHLHDTRGTALANILVGLEHGVRTFDASVGGLGGCPYAPGAAGNVATEDLVYMLHAMGVSTGIDLDALWEAGQVAEAVVGRPLPGKVHKAGTRWRRS
ncbi:MAG: hydroxymethylglutaryl-CoA lyase [Deltaproteobacteria bacterium]|nr:hydroxymethylglutaryl-CoA lyase [Deltaproteobacteria bacterium]